MLFTTNNEMARYTAKALENSRIWVSTPIGGVRDEIGVTTFRNAIGAHYYDKYVYSPSLAIVKPWFVEIGYNGEIGVKGTLKKSCLPPSVNNSALKPNQPEEPPFTEHMLAVCNTVMPNVPKAPEPSSNTERVPQGKKLRVKPGHKKHSTSSKQPFVSSNEATKDGSSKRLTGSKTGHLKRKKDSSSTMDFNPSQTSASTSMVAEMHKEDQQATSDPNSLGVTTEEGSTLSSVVSASGNDTSADFTIETDPEISAPNDSVPHQQGPDEGFKNYTHDHTFARTYLSVLVNKTKSTGDGSQIAHTVSGTKVDTRLAFMDDENQDDEPFIAPEESSKKNAKRNEDTHAKPKSTLVPTPSLSVQIQELQAQFLLLKSHNQKLEKDKEKVAAKIANLKAQFMFPTINQLTDHLVSSMKPEFSKLLSSHDFSGSIPTELKELPTKITALYVEVNELKKPIKEFEIELPEAKFFSSISYQDSLEALPGILNKVTDTLNRFSSILNAHNKGVPSAGKSTALLAGGEKNTNPVIEDAELANLVDLMGIDVVEEYHKKMLLYNNDLHLAEWREVIQACPDKSEKGWKTIYGLIVTTSRYVVPTGRVKVPAGRYVVPTGRVKVPAGRYVVPTGNDKFIVSAGRTKAIPAGSTILVLRILRIQGVRVSWIFKTPTALDEGVKIYLWLDLQVVSEPGESLC
ncbi:hypothetical protein Tco_1468226 [Tanacetum coccineum]